LGGAHRFDVRRDLGRWPYDCVFVAAGADPQQADVFVASVAGAGVLGLSD